MAGIPHRRGTRLVVPDQGSLAVRDAVGPPLARRNRAGSISGFPIRRLSVASSDLTLAPLGLAGRDRGFLDHPKFLILLIICNADWSKPFRYMHALANAKTLNYEY
jgi:hypothetical protein